MAFEWDEAKRRTNQAKHGLDFADLEKFDWSDPVTCADDRKDYGELRLIALADFAGALHAVVFTRRGANVRIISFRRANRKEVKRYEKEKVQPR